MSTDTAAQNRRIAAVVRKVGHLNVVAVQTVMLAVMLVALIAIGFIGWRINLAAECIVENFAEHRTRNESAHRDIATAVGSHYEAAPGDLPESNPELLKKACRQFRGHD